MGNVDLSRGCKLDSGSWNCAMAAGTEERNVTKVTEMTLSMDQHTVGPL